MCIGLPLALLESYTTHTSIKQIRPKYRRMDIEISISVPNDESSGMYFSIAVFLGLNCTCYVLIAICYIILIRTVYKSSKRAGLNREMKNQIRLTLKVAAIVATDFLCWFPVILLGICVQTKVLTLPPSVFAWVVTFVLPINSAINPYLYTVADIVSYRKRRATVDTLTVPKQDGRLDRISVIALSGSTTSSNGTRRQQQEAVRNASLVLQSVGSTSINLPNSIQNETTESNV